MRGLRQRAVRGNMDGRRVVQRLVNGQTALDIAGSFGYRSARRVMDWTRDFIVAKLGAERYSCLADQPRMGYVRIARTLGREALKKTRQRGPEEELSWAVAAMHADWRSLAAVIALCVRVRTLPVCPCCPEQAR